MNFGIYPISRIFDYQLFDWKALTIAENQQSSGFFV